MSGGCNLVIERFLVQSPSVLQEDTQPLIAPDEQVDTLNGSLCQKWMNVCVNVRHTL